MINKCTNYYIYNTKILRILKKIKTKKKERKKEEEAKL